MKSIKRITFCVLFLCVFTNCNWYLNSSSIKLNPAQLRDTLVAQNVQLIDVRTPKEFNQGHIKSAININYHSKNFKDSLAILNVEKPVYIYCRSGKRSAKSVSIFKELGFTKIYELEGGILNWLSNDLKISE